MQIAPNENHLEAAINHFNEQIDIYGQQILINLVRKYIFFSYLLVLVFIIIIIICEKID